MYCSRGENGNLVAKIEQPACAAFSRTGRMISCGNFHAQSTAPHGISDDSAKADANADKRTPCKVGDQNSEPCTVHAKCDFVHT